MSKRFKRLDPNLRLKIASVILALLTWYIINYFSDPTMRMTVSNVSVQITHEEAIEKHGDVYTILDDSDVIPTVTIRAKRSVIDKLEAKNVIATADLRQVEEDGAVRISLTTDKYANSIESITGSIGFVQLRIEPMETKSLPIEVLTTGSPAEGYILHETSAEQNQVIINGPQSYLKQVARAAVEVDITDSERNINSYPAIVLYNNDNEEITSEEMQSQKLKLNISSVKVVATIDSKKTVNITCGSEVPLADGYELESEPETDPSSIEIAGAAAILRDIDTIEIPAEDIAVQPVSSNIHKNINIENYLPDGAYLVDEDSDKVTVYIRVSQKEDGSASGADSSTGDGAS